MEVRQLTCINCPMGCQLEVTLEGTKVVSVTGNTCPRGDIYARKEVVHPTRIVTSTVRVDGGALPVASVKTKSDIPKDKIFDVMEAIDLLRVKAPVHIGDVLKENIANTGVELVATRNVGLK